MKIVACHQPNYIPWLGYFQKMSLADCFIFLDDVQLPLSSGWENRNRIRNDDGWLWLTVPVSRKGRETQLIKDTDIDFSTKWPRKHFLSLFHSYKKAPYFNEHLSFLESTYQNPPARLIDLNLIIISYIKEYLGITTKTFFASDFHIDQEGSKRLAALVQAVDGQVYLAGDGDDGYQNHECFSDVGLRIRKMNYTHPEYNQIHGQFIPCMSILDGLFNLGPSLRDLLKHNAGTA